MNNTSEPEGSCYICGDEESPIHGHHIIPRRLNGSDEPHNIVDLCEKCHFAVERIYDERFWNLVEHKFAGQYMKEVDGLKSELAVQKSKGPRRSIADEIRAEKLINESTR